MKKLFLLVAMTIVTMSASAQLITSTRAIKGERAHNFWVDLGGGGFNGDVNDSGFGVDLGIRVTKMWNSVGWDIFRLSATTDTKDFGGAANVKLKTGIRYISPAVVGDMKLYANADMGYGFYPDNTDWHGSAWEAGVGIMLTNRISAGVVYDSQYYSVDGVKYDRYWLDFKEEKNFHIGFIGARFGFAL